MLEKEGKNKMAIKDRRLKTAKSRKKKVDITDVVKDVSVARKAGKKQVEGKQTRKPNLTVKERQAWRRKQGKNRTIYNKKMYEAKEKKKQILKESKMEKGGKVTGHRIASLEKGKKGKTTAVVQVDRPEGKRYYSGEAKKKSTQLARNTAVHRALVKAETTPADSLRGYKLPGEEKKSKSKKKKKKFGIFEEGGKVNASSNGGGESNPYGWPSKDARNGGKK